LDKIQFYLTSKKFAEQIRVAGRNRALMGHTYHKRFGDLFKKIEHE